MPVAASWTATRAVPLLAPASTLGAVVCLLPSSDRTEWRSGSSHAIRSLRMCWRENRIPIVGRSNPRQGLRLLRATMTSSLRTRLSSLISRVSTIVDAGVDDTCSAFYPRFLTLSCLSLCTCFSLLVCGDWAGNTYGQSGCPGTCAQRVMQPGNFGNAQWNVTSVKVYQWQ